MSQSHGKTVVIMSVCSALGIAASVLLTALVSRHVPETVLADFVQMRLLTLFGVAILTVGLPGGLVRFISGAETPSVARNIANRGLSFLIVFPLAAYAVAFLLRDAGAQLFVSRESGWMRAACVYGYACVFVFSTRSVLLGKCYPILDACIGVVIQSVTPLVVIASLLMRGLVLHVCVVWAGAAMIVGIIPFAILSLVVQPRERDTAEAQKRDSIGGAGLSGGIFRYSFKRWVDLWLTSLNDLLLPPILLIAGFPREQVKLLLVVIVGIRLVPIVVYPVQGLILPRLSRAVAIKDNSLVRRLLKQCSEWGLFLIVGAGIGSVFAAQPLFELYLGYDFTPWRTEAILAIFAFGPIAASHVVREAINGVSVSLANTALLGTATLVTYSLVLVSFVFVPTTAMVLVAMITGRLAHYIMCSIYLMRVRRSFQEVA